MTTEEAIKDLSDTGLNIFLASLVKNSPPFLYEAFLKQKIPYHPEDTLILLGHGGKHLWNNLAHPLETKTHPIDTYSLKKMHEFNENILKDENFQILYPSDQWTLPLQQLGRFFNFCGPSPLGIDISSEFGLWFAFRGAFLTKSTLPLLRENSFNSPCLKCADKPCEKKSSLEEARLACPYKIEHQYGPEQRNYHQKALTHIKK